MQLSKDKDNLLKQFEEKDIEMQKMKEAFKQERAKYHGQIKEARKLIESLEADKGKFQDTTHNIFYFRIDVAGYECHSAFTTILITLF